MPDLWINNKGFFASIVMDVGAGVALECKDDFLQNGSL